MTRLPLIAANRIAGNLERLVNDALERYDPSKEAIQWLNLELGMFECQTSVLVIDYDPRPGRTSADRAYLIAEVIDDNTREEVENHLFLYRDLRNCQVILAIKPNWVCVHLPVKGLAPNMRRFVRSTRCLNL